MDRNFLISASRHILLNVSNRKVLEYFYSFPKNQDIVIEIPTEIDIEKFIERNLLRFSKYITEE